MIGSTVLLYMFVDAWSQRSRGWPRHFRDEKLTPKRDERHIHSTEPADRRIIIVANLYPEWESDSKVTIVLTELVSSSADGTEGALPVPHENDSPIVSSDWEEGGVSWDGTCSSEEDISLVVRWIYLEKGTANVRKDRDFILHILHDDKK